jgi:hypothetical protein
MLSAGATASDPAMPERASISTNAASQDSVDTAIGFMMFPRRVTIGVALGNENEKSSRRNFRHSGSMLLTSHIAEFLPKFDCR